MQLKNNNLSYLIALALMAGGVAANADSINDPNSSGSWQSWNSSNLVVNSASSGVGTPYWNNPSGDGPMENIGWCMAGGGNCSMPAGAPGALSYYGNGTGSLGSMYFTGTGSAVTVNLQTILTTQTTTGGGYDIFGYYLATSSGTAGSSVTLNTLFDSRTSTVGTSVTMPTMAVNQKYGFFIENVQGSGTQFATNYVYLMDSTANSSNGSMAADSLQHFAAFSSGNGTYFLGDVDDDSCQGSYQTGTSPCVPSTQFDYNNMIVEVTTNAPTPEPASLGLIGGALVMGALLRRKKNLGVEN